MTQGFPVPGAIDTVIFDFHTTLVDQGDSDGWLAEACGRTRVDLDEDQAAELTTFLHLLWDHAREVDPDAERDLSAARHREVYDELMTRAPHATPELVDALYEAVSDGWRAYSDAAPVLAALRDMGVAVVVLSNTGIDISGVLRREGLMDYVDGMVLSWQVGAVKPDPRIFAAALATVGAKPANALMVGDSESHDAGGVPLGIRTLILPRTGGAAHGLRTVLGVVAASRRPDFLD